MLENTECQFARDGFCEVSTLLASLPVVLDEKACRACRLNANPRSINPVTCSRAAWAARRAGMPVPPETFNCVKEGQNYGPGTELKRILSRITKTNKNCGCESRANIMNVWGPDECERRMPEIVGWLREEAHKKWPATKVLPIDWAIENIVRRAINRARRKIVRNQPKNTTGQT